MRTLMALLALVLPVFPSQEGKPERRRGLPQAYLEAEAGYAASTLCQEAVIPEALLAEIREVLGKVRASSPQVAGLQVTFPWGLRSFILDVEQELFDRIREYKGDWAEFDFQDPVLNDFRDRHPIGRMDALQLGGFKNMVTVRLKEIRPSRNLPVVVKEVGRSRAVRSVMLDYMMGGGNELFIRKKGPQWRVAFCSGKGDLPAGAIHRNYWYFTVEGDKVTPIETASNEPGRGPRLYLWGFPDRTCVGVYKDLDTLLGTARKADETWRRAHALKAAGILLKEEAVLEAGEDDAAAFRAFREQAAPRRGEILDLLLEGFRDMDEEVRAGARRGLSKITRKDLGDDPGAWADFLGRPRKK